MEGSHTLLYLLLLLSPLVYKNKEKRFYSTIQHESLSLVMWLLRLVSISAGADLAVSSVRLQRACKRPSFAVGIWSSMTCFSIRRSKWTRRWVY
jgi:hypothetical protein